MLLPFVSAISHYKNVDYDKSPASKISLGYNNQALEDNHSAPSVNEHVSVTRRKQKKEPFACKDEVGQFMIDRWQEEPVLLK